MIKFIGEIYQIGINPVVDPPDDVLTAVFEQAGRSKSPIPVRGFIGGTPFIQTLVKYGGMWRLYINGAMLKASGLTVGDSATIEIEVDTDPREVPMPELFRKALENDREACIAFNELTSSRQKEIKRYLGSLKTEGSLIRNIERVLRHLTGEKTDKLHALMRTEKKT